MTIEQNLVSQASNLGKVLLKGNDAEIVRCADEILLLLNRFQDFVRQNPGSTLPPSFLNDIVYRLESEPEAALQDKVVRTRLLDLFLKVARS
jgi:hypothetical protein